MNAGPPALVVASSLPSLRAARSLLLSLARDAIPSRAQHSSIHPLRPGRADIVLAGAVSMLRLLSGGRAHSDCVGREALPLAERAAAAPPLSCQSQLPSTHFPAPTPRCASPFGKRAPNPRLPPQRRLVHRSPSCCSAFLSAPAYPGARRASPHFFFPICVERLEAPPRKAV